MKLYFETNRLISVLLVKTQHKKNYLELKYNIFNLGQSQNDLL